MHFADRGEALIHYYRVSVRRFIGVVVLCCAPGTLGGADALRQAAEALEKDNFRAAIPHLEAALEEDPGNTNARFNLAYAYQATGEDDDAINHYRRIAEEQPDLIPARQNLATLLMRAGNHAEAAREFEAVASARPDDFAVRLMLASALRESGDPDASAVAYRQVLDLDESSLDALLGLAGVLEELGRLPEAVAFYLRAAAIDPDLEDALPEIAGRLEQSGARQDAVELYRRFARSHPDNADVQEEVGILLLEDGNFRAAAASLERAVAIAPNATRHAALAEAYRGGGHSDAARKHLHLAVEAAPRDTGVRVRYANALLQQREFEQAAEQYWAVCQADAQARDAWNGLAFAMFQLENYQVSLRALERAEALGEPFPASVYLKALAQDKLQLFELAQASYQAFLAMSSGMSDEEWKAQQRLKTIARVLAKR